MVSQQKPYVVPREEIREQPSRLHVRAFAIEAFVIIVSMVMMVTMVGILLSSSVLTALGLTGALIGIGIAGLVLLCINVVFGYMLFTHIKE